MTVVEAAKRIGISPSKLYQLVAERRIAHYRVGGKIVFSDADVDAYMQGCRVPVIAPAASDSRPLPKLKHLNLLSRRSA